MTLSDRRGLRRMQLLLAAGALLVVALPVAWPRLGLPASGGIWDDIGGPSSTVQAAPAPGQPAAPGPTGPRPQPGPRVSPGRKLHPATIPTRGTVIAPTRPVVARKVVRDACHFFQAAQGIPVAWSHAGPIPFVVRRTAGPPDGLELVLQALQRISNASGYRFTFQGLTETLPTAASAAGRTDLWIGWAFDDELPNLRDPSGDSSTILGVGGPTITAGPGARPAITGASAALRADQNTSAGFGPGVSMGNVLLHELGHALGLEHTTTDGTLMFPSLSTRQSDGLDASAVRALQSLYGQKRC